MCHMCFTLCFIIRNVPSSGFLEQHGWKVLLEAEIHWYFRKQVSADKAMGLRIWGKLQNFTRAQRGKNNLSAHLRELSSFYGWKCSLIDSFSLYKMKEFLPYWLIICSFSWSRSSAVFSYSNWLLLSDLAECLLPLPFAYRPWTEQPMLCLRGVLGQ